MSPWLAGTEAGWGREPGGIHSLRPVGTRSSSRPPRVRTGRGTPRSYLHVASAGRWAAAPAVHVGEPVHAGRKLHTERRATPVIGLYLVHRHGGTKARGGSACQTPTIRNSQRPRLRAATSLLTLLRGVRENAVWCALIDPGFLTSRTRPLTEPIGEKERREVFFRPARKGWSTTSKAANGSPGGGAPVGAVEGTFPVPGRIGCCIHGAS